MQTANGTALVVLSGGQDSTTCLFWAIERFGRDSVSSITFDYGQRHRIELECAKQVAAAYAYQRNMGHLVTGVAQTDYSGYPDCREETIKSLQETLRLGMESRVRIHTPLMNLSKKETVELAVELGGLAALALTHTCYNGERPPCGTCPACVLRAKGFSEAEIVDPLIGAHDLLS